MSRTRTVHLALLATVALVGFGLRVVYDDRIGCVPIVVLAVRAIGVSVPSSGGL
jgi:hypothetical protein